MEKNISDKLNEALTAIYLYVILRWIVILTQYFLTDSQYKTLCFKLIEFCNKHFHENEKILSEFRENVIYDMRVMRDKYDHSGMELYFNLVKPEELVTGKNVLDLGCGVGGKCEEFLKYSPVKVLGIDLSQRNIDYAKELINNSNRSVLDFQSIDLMDFEDRSQFDSIVSYTVFEHIDRKIMIKILNKMASVLNEKGNILIVFNHFNDRFGSHLKEYIFHPWPQTIFSESVIFDYWNTQLQNDPKVTSDSYFPKDYNHGTDGHNSDCYMNLNKISIQEFEEMILNSNLKLVQRFNYSRSPLLEKYPFLPKKYLEGSAVYHLTKR